MPAPNTQFELSVEDLDLIETALRDQSNTISHQNGPDEKTRKLHELLGRLHNQKVFFRPKAGAYIGG
ncbi:MAG: hypothetical protein AAF701_04895 [Pseudomonadota bacterium]